MSDDDEKRAMDAAMETARAALASVYGDKAQGITIIAQVADGKHGKSGRFDLFTFSSGWCCRACRNLALAAMLADQSPDDTTPATTH